MPVRIKRLRAAMRQNLAFQRNEISARGLGRRKMQPRQARGRSVDKHDQRAARAAPFKPVVRAAVDLDQLAKTRTALDGLARNRYLRLSGQLSGRQSRTKIKVFAAEPKRSPARELLEPVDASTHARAGAASPAPPCKRYARTSRFTCRKPIRRRSATTCCKTVLPAA